MKLIALSGRAGSGKDTVASFLPARRVAFADPLKDFAKDVFAFTENQVRGPSSERNRPDLRYPRKHGPWPMGSDPGRRCLCCGHEVLPGAEPPNAPQCYLTPRYALQTLGTEWGRDCYPGIWTDYGIRRARFLMDQGYDVVITDCRFTNEARAVREAGGQVWQIVRPGVGLATPHPSEVEQESDEFRKLVSFTIRNDGTLEQLAGQTALLWG